MKYDFTPEREQKSADWKRMYTILLRGIDNALEVLPKTDDTREARRILKNAMERAEKCSVGTGGERV